MIEFTDATPGFNDVQTPPDTVLVNIVVVPTHVPAEPPIDDNTTVGLTLTVATALATQPFVVTV